MSPEEMDPKKYSLDEMTIRPLRPDWGSPQPEPAADDGKRTHLRVVKLEPSPAEDVKPAVQETTLSHATEPTAGLIRPKAPAPSAGVTSKKKPAPAASVEAMVAPLLALSDPVTMDEIKVAMRQTVTNAMDADPFDRELVKERAKSILKSVGCSAPAPLVRAAFASAGAAGKLAGQPIIAPDPEPWLVPVDGAALLTAMRDVFPRYSVLCPYAAELLALNVLRTYVMDAFDFNPTIAVPSPTKRCGKTTLLEVNEHLVARPLFVSGIKPAGIYRAIEESHPTMILDEADTYESMKERYKGILNSGHHRPSAWFEVQVPTPTGAWIPRKFSTYAPLFLGFIGAIPDTLLDRAIAIPMKRKKPTERVTLFEDTEKAALLPLKRKALRWGLDNLKKLRKVKPSLPEGLDDRAVDCWRPLLAIAQLAGGPWPQLAQAAALALSGADQREDTTVDTYLLQSLRGLFGNMAKLPSRFILSRLNQDEEAPWRRWNNGAGLDEHDLGTHLRPYGARSKTLYWSKDDWSEVWGPLWVGPVGDNDGGVHYPKGGMAKGYERSRLEDPWERYVPTVPTDLTP